MTEDTISLGTVQLSSDVANSLLPYYRNVVIFFKLPVLFAFLHDFHTLLFLAVNKMFP